MQDYLYTTRSILNYKETRNGLVGVDYSSKFSPWLALGSLSPKWIYYAIREFEKENGANDSTYWLIFELLWRDFFRFMIKKHGEKYFLYNCISGKHETAPERNDKVLLSWIEGYTGDDFVDANMRELATTGFMSNRGRQNVASYFINDLKQDWRVGAAYFEQELIDYDPAVITVTGLTWQVLEMTTGQIVTSIPGSRQKRMTRTEVTGKSGNDADDVVLSGNQKKRAVPKYSSFSDERMYIFTKQSGLGLKKLIL